MLLLLTMLIKIVMLLMMKFDELNDLDPIFHIKEIYLYFVFPLNHFLKNWAK